MNERIKTIYTYLYERSEYCTKAKLANIFDINPKTIENTLKPLNDEIVFDKILERYRFNTLLPKYIPYKVFYKLFQDSIVNNIIKEDFLKIEETINSSENALMIETSKLSKIAQRIIMFSIAMNDNCMLNIEYTKPGSNEIENKFVQPNTIFTNGFTYYCYVTYDEKNKKDVGKQRTLAFTRIGNIKANTYITNKVFKIEQKGNAFGPFNKENYVLLEFDRLSSSFFQMEKMFDSGQYEIIEMDMKTGIYIVKMYYNNLEIEVLKIIQQWMPHIKVHPTDENKDLIYENIKRNYLMLGILE
ncbi:MAG: hypothetical protein PHS65_00655 [Arcobacteraceae bacterium]|nr:hypothetical protein [Arcobacteraceae bacterium]